MDEHLPDSYGPPTAYAPAEVQQLTEGDRWQSLTPNAYSPDHDLLPRDLDAEQLNTLVETLMADPNLAAFQQDGREASAAAADAFKSRDLGEMGTLSLVDNGEAKICYCLERNGKKMAVVLQSYDNGKQIDVPTDPRLTKVTAGASRSLWEYSDLRTYAMLPLTDRRAIKLQEFGEPPQGGWGIATGGLRTAVARRGAKKYIQNQLPNAMLGPDSNTVRELEQSRHALTKPGYGNHMIIDVPVVERVA